MNRLKQLNSILDLIVRGLGRDETTDSLISLKHISKTRTPRECYGCHKPLPIGSEAYRSFVVTGGGFPDPIYRCTECIDTLIRKYEGLRGRAVCQIAYNESEL